MAHLMYAEDYYVLLETNQPEQILTAAELGDRLAQIIPQIPEQLPPSLDRFENVAEKVHHLIVNYCELTLEDGGYFQWYAVRLEK